MTENPDLLAYLGQPFETTELDGQLWLRADEIGQVMCLAEPEQDVNRVHQMNWQQFSDRLTAFVGVETREGPRLMRAFNLLGAYVLSTYFLSLDAQQFRRWLLETLIFHQIDVRREIQRLLALNAELEKRIAALEAGMAQLKQAFKDFTANKNPESQVPGKKDWLEGEFRRLREQQAHQADLLLGLSQVLQAAPPAQAAAHSVIAAPAGPAPRALAQFGPIPVHLGEIGGKPCPVVSALDVVAFIGQYAFNDPSWYRFHMGNYIEETGLREGVDYERLHFTGPLGTAVYSGLYHLSLDSAVAIARQWDGATGDLCHWARQLAAYLLDCKSRLADWESAQPGPTVAPLPDKAGCEAQSDEPMVLYFGEMPLRIAKYEDGLPWVVAADVCTVLNIKNVSQALESLCEDEKRICLAYTLGGTQGLWSVSYGGLSTLILRCRDAIKPGNKAYEFRRWVTNEMLVEVYKTGRYEHPGHGRIVQPSPTAIPATETLPNPSIAAKPEEPASEEPAKAASKPVTTKASKPKAQNATKPKPSKPANGEGQA